MPPHVNPLSITSPATPEKKFASADIEVICPMQAPRSDGSFIGKGGGTWQRHWCYRPLMTLPTPYAPVPGVTKGEVYQVTWTGGSALPYKRILQYLFNYLKIIYFHTFFVFVLSIHCIY